MTLRHLHQRTSGLDKARRQTFLAAKSILLMKKQSSPKIPSLYFAHDFFNVAGCAHITHDQRIRRAESLEALSDQLCAHDCPHALVGYPNPELAVIEFLQIGKSLPEALTSWASAAEKFIEFCRRHRDQTTIFDCHAAGNSPDIFLRALSSELKITNTVDPALLSVAKTNIIGKGRHLVVKEALSRSSLTAPYFLDIKANSLLLGPAYDLDTAALLSPESEGGENKAILELREDRELLMQQLHQIQEELESHNSTAQKESELQREIIILQRDLARKNKDLRAVRASLSWRVTSPARRVMSIFMGKSGIGD